MATSHRPIALTDVELDAIMTAAAPLAPRDRSAFLEDVARELVALPEIGSGILHRVLASVQRRHWSPPLESGNHRAPRYLGSKRQAPHVIKDDAHD
jgi:hypothetical protein